LTFSPQALSLSDVTMDGAASVGHNWVDMTLWSEDKTCEFFHKELGLNDLSGIRANGVNGKILQDLITTQRPWLVLKTLTLPTNQVSK
jgi:hypothetical protein